ncbi:MAG: Fpg/Nei family DNA glycosylase [Deltaproteobacteria bacterium]|nr:Fpg/Nei family DNA glycosylase [Deltaproteobacteria bacterium]
MPEGDTIHRIATTLAPLLVGQTLERVTTQGLVRGVAGRVVASVAAHGKHLVIELDDGTALRAHLGMYGRFRRHARAEGEEALARISPGRVSLAVVTAGGVYLWIGARTIEISPRRAPLHGVAISTLGPDVLGDHFDSRQAASRAAVHASCTVGEVLLDQRVVAGIGNVYKSEVLFVRGLDPRTRVGAIAEAQLDLVYATARDLMFENLGPAPRSTRERQIHDTPRDRYFVYGRTGMPCRRCAMRIACYALGDPPRWTWSCATCQPHLG